jgi:hypothetical protein
MNDRDRKRMERMARKGHFELDRVFSRSRVSARFVTGDPKYDTPRAHLGDYDPRPSWFISFRKPSRTEDLQIISNSLQQYANTCCDSWSSDYEQTFLILQQKFVEFVASIPPEQFAQADASNAEEALRSAKDNLQRAVRTFFKRGGTHEQMLETVSEFQVELVHES